MTNTAALIKRDKQFCKDCQTDGAKAWMSYLSDDAIMGTSSNNPYIDDTSMIKQVMEDVFRLESISFVWEPRYAFISDDETLGVTTGYYERRYKNEGKEVVQKGKYVTTWKKITREWKVVFDMGN